MATLNGEDIGMFMATLKYQATQWDPIYVADAEPPS